MANRGTKAQTAELLFYKWLILTGYPRDGLRKAVRAKYQKQDFLGCDVLACRDGRLWFVQLTTIGGTSDRRRKLEKLQWGLLPALAGIRISIACHERIPRPENRNLFDHYWVVEDYLGGDKWGEKEAIPFDKKAVEAVKVKAEK